MEEVIKPLKVEIREELEPLELSINSCITVTLEVSACLITPDYNFTITMCGNDLAEMKTHFNEEMFKAHKSKGFPYGHYGVSMTVEKGEEWQESDEWIVTISQTGCQPKLD